MEILGYNAISAAGRTSEELLSALLKGAPCSQKALDGGFICPIPKSSEKEMTTVRERLGLYLQENWDRVRPTLPSEISDRLNSGARVAFVFASTKGIIEDFIWTDASDGREAPDPFSAVIDDFLSKEASLNWVLSCGLSNACSSTHVALEYVQELFEQDRMDFAFLFAADLVGPFISQGFQSLKLVSPTGSRPFGENRDGLQLGEGAALFLLAKNGEFSRGLRLTHVRSETEGSSITRPSQNGDGLFRALKSLEAGSLPDLVIAHGTGTVFNDQAEDQALRQLAASGGLDPKTPVTNTKWCLGHTLGASGAMDLAAGCEILKRQKVFRIESTDRPDPKLTMNYLMADRPLPAGPIRKILISSLGFGGVHAGLSLEKTK
ncbi:MAG TPA: beta-ketoacyl synthase N-terminal-like domain-containing protein [Pseudobdellovibrionaceae bacterium]|nr:beta-ketoacyl synthase N-terminal-like domain-containing protein [Pseudobdellovibrionaceae bacterium]